MQSLENSAQTPLMVWWRVFGVDFFRRLRQSLKVIWRREKLSAIEAMALQTFRGESSK
jgi:hypothetical protein